MAFPILLSDRNSTLKNKSNKQLNNTEMLILKMKLVSLLPLIVDSIAKSSIAVPTSGLLPFSIAALTGGRFSWASNVLS